MISLSILRHSKYGRDAFLAMRKKMKKYKAALIPVLASSVTLILLSGATSVLAQDTTYPEEYMQQHDGGDRAEYLQEMEHSDPRFYVPPVNDASLSSTDNNVPSN
jgi:hypothetical protein